MGDRPAFSSSLEGHRPQYAALTAPGLAEQSHGGDLDRRTRLGPVPVETGVLFLEGQRNYDVERFQIPFNPPVGDPFPFKGGTYGNTTCLPLPDVEKNNNPSLGPSFVPSVTGS